MSLRFDGEIAWLQGACEVEEAEPLAAALESGVTRTLDLSGVQRLHSAVIQVILYFRPKIQNAPKEPFLRNFVALTLAGAGEAASDALSTDSDV